MNPRGAFSLDGDTGTPKRGITNREFLLRGTLPIGTEGPGHP